MHLFTEQKQIHKYRKPTYGYQKEKWGGGVNLEFGISRYTNRYTISTDTLLYIKQINDKVLLYSLGNHIQSISFNFL